MIQWKLNAIMSNFVASNELKRVRNTLGDACTQHPGDVLMFSCTITGGGITIWAGTAFNCPSTANEIILHHSLGTSFGGCNGGAITAGNLGVVGHNCYSSQLNVTLSSDMNDKTIACTHNSGSTVTLIGVETLSLSVGAGK